LYSFNHFKKIEKLKKYFVTAAALAIIAACNSGTTTGSSSDSASGATTAAPAADDVTTNPDYQKGLALIAANDCLTCHKVSEKLTGPAYQDVANKYENTDDNIKMLAGKILKGGSGVWGNVAMTPHPALAEADAEQMAKYIMLLKTNK